MRIHYLQHVPFEDAANIEVWAHNRGHTVTKTRLDLDEDLPSLDTFDFLVIMGGPMNIYEHEQYPWLIREKAFILDMIKAGKFVFGVCLGAQLISDVLGGLVTVNAHKEIGWFDTSLTPNGKEDSILNCLPEEFEAFHWHGDTFTIPPDGALLAGSEACKNQAFQYGEKVLALQFHLDYSLDSIEQMIEHCSDELDLSEYCQKAEQLADEQKTVILKHTLYCLLDSFIGCA